MADDRMRITNFPDGGSAERVAYDLYNQVRVLIPEGEGRTIKEHLDLYAECLQATTHQRLISPRR